MLQVYRSKNYRRNQTTFITRLIKDTSSNQCALQQLFGIFECIEKLSSFKDHSHMLTDIVKCILEDSHELGNQDQLEVDIVIKRLREI